MKTMHLREKWLKIIISFYSPVRGLRTAYHAKEDSWSRVRGLGSSH